MRLHKHEQMKCFTIAILALLHLGDQPTELVQLPCPIYPDTNRIDLWP